MRIGVIGTGNMARALGRQWVRAGHELLVAGRDKQKASALSSALGDSTMAGSLLEATSFGQVTLVAVRRTGVLETLRNAGAAHGSLAGQVVIDCTNPIDEADSFRLVTAGGPSMAEQIAHLAVGAEVSKAFNLCSADLWQMAPPAIAGVALTVPFCGATSQARDVTRALITDVGCHPLDIGGLDRAGQLEAVAAFGIRLMVEGTGFGAVMPPIQPGPPPGHEAIN